MTAVAVRGSEVRVRRGVAWSSGRVGRRWSSWRVVVRFRDMVKCCCVNGPGVSLERFVFARINMLRDKHFSAADNSDRTNDLQMVA